MVSKKISWVLALAAMLSSSAGWGGPSAPGCNLLPNANFAKVRSGYWPDWWNWYPGLGDDRIKIDECWQLADEHRIPGTRSVKLSSSARLMSSFLPAYFEKDTTFTLSAWMKGSRPDTRVEMLIGGWTGFNEVKEVTVGTEWSRFHVTGTTTSRLGQSFITIGLLGDGPVWVNAPQLEEGGAPTEWKLAPKDLPGNERAEAQKPAEPKFPMPRIEVPMVAKAPVVDGLLEDAAWQEAVATKTFTRLDEEAPAKYSTDAYICRDEENVYVAFRCREPEMDKLTAKATLRDAVGVFQDDCVEIFLSTNEDGADYLHVAANALGTKYDAKGYTMFFDAEWECATARAADHWSAEFRLPLSSLVRPRRPGGPWRLNLARSRARPKEEEASAWAPVVKTYHDAPHFGFLLGVPAEAGRPAAETTAGGKLVAYVDRSFYTTEGAAELFVDAPAGTPVHFTLGGLAREEPLPATRLLLIDLSALAPGEHPIEVRAGAAGTDLVLAKLPPKAGAVKIDRLHRVFLVDDKPFIPIGPNAANAARVKSLADLGFNSPYAQMHTAFTPEAQAQLREVLDAAQARGVKIPVWYFDYALADDHAKWQAELLAVVEMFKDHPALLAWWVYDEPVSNIRWLAGLCDAVRNADPYHPVFVNWCDRGHGWMSEMGDVAGDVNCMDGYYINAYDYTPREAFLKIGGHCAAMTADARRRGNVVAYVHGLYGWAEAIREPSPQENRFITYVSLIKGARILFYYNWGPPANPALRESFKPLCREIETLTPIVDGREARERVACDNARIDYTAFETAEGLYVIALNTDKRDEEAAFRIEGVTGEAVVLFEDRNLPAAGGSVRDRFGPLDRHVYRVK